MVQPDRNSNPAAAGQLTRRSFVLRTVSLAAVLCSSRVFGAVPGSRFSSYPFSLGVASGDPAPDGFVLWTRLAPRPLEPGGGMPAAPVDVAWEISEDEGMTRIVRSGTARAEPDWAHSVHVEVHGLRPDRWYWYRFRAAGETSPVGRTRTFPPPGSLPERLRFAFASCQHFEHGYYTAFEHMEREELDLIVHLGDYIYEGGFRQRERPTELQQERQHNGPEIFSLDDYRARYALYKTDPALQAAHAAAPWVVTWDDHEVANNYAADIPQFKESMGREEFLRRRTAAYKAYYEHMPLRLSSRPQNMEMALFRRLAYGRLASFHVLDTRQYRSNQPCGEASGAILMPCEERFDPEGTMLGAAQRQWLFDGLERSGATWNVLAQQILFACIDRAPGPEVSHSMDQWAGYEFERRRVLRHFLERRISNPVVLTGDIHSNWANELVLDFDEFDGQSVGTEFVGTSITSGGDGALAPDHVDQFLAENSFVKFHNTERGYVRCEVTPQEWRTDFRTVPFVRRRGAPLNTRASFVVEAGRPLLNRV